MAALTGNWRRTDYRRTILGRKPRPGPDAAQALAAACAAAPAPSAAEAPERCRHCNHGVVAGRAFSPKHVGECNCQDRGHALAPADGLQVGASAPLLGAIADLPIAELRRLEERLLPLNAAS